MLKKVIKGLFYMIVMYGSIWAAEGFTEMICDEIIRWMNFDYNLFGAIERVFKHDPDAVCLYLIVIFALTFTVLELGKKTVALVEKEEKGES
jgi:hypothetical protein